jgi:transcriptional regulator with XRE-family HTH domain
MKQKSKDIEAQLIDAIRKCGMTFYELAEVSGVDRAALSRLLSGERSLTLKSAAKVAKVLKLELHRVEDDDHVA